MHVIVYMHERVNNGVDGLHHVYLRMYLRHVYPIIIREKTVIIGLVAIKFANSLCTSRSKKCLLKGGVTIMILVVFI